MEGHTAPEIVQLQIATPAISGTNKKNEAELDRESYLSESEAISWSHIFRFLLNNI